MVPVLPYAQKLARKPLDFSVQTPEPETVLFRGKDDPLRLGLPNIFKTAICGKFKDINAPVNIGKF